MVIILASGSSCLGSIFKIPEFFSVKKINDVAQDDQLRWVEESGQWLENFDRTHLVLASCKPVLHKRLTSL